MNSDKITIGELELFVELSKLQSLRELARNKNIEVAQLSRTVKRLEEKVGHNLFTRSHRGLIPTPHAIKLRKEVELAFKYLDFTPNLSTEKKVNLEGVGAPSFLMDSLVLPTISKVFKNDLVQNSQIVELPPDRLVLSGLRGIIKIAFHAGELNWPSNWISEKIGSLEWKLLGSNKFFDNEFLSEEELLEIPFVYPIYWSPEGLREAEDKCPIPLKYRKKSIGVSSGKMAVQLIKDNKFLCFIPASLLTDEDRYSLKEIRPKNWKTHVENLYMSVQVDSLSKSLYDHLIMATKEIIKAKSSNF